MKQPNFIDCYKLDLIKDIPEELTLANRQREQLLVKNQKLKKVIWTLSVGLGCLLIYTIINDYGKKKNTKEHTQKQNRRQ